MGLDHKEIPLAEYHLAVKWQSWVLAPVHLMAKLSLTKVAVLTRSFGKYMLRGLLIPAFYSPIALLSVQGCARFPEHLFSHVPPW